MDERIIEAVRDCIWQFSNRAYKDLRAKENAWKEVAAKVGEGFTVDDCMRKWKLLRDKFVRELKKVKNKKTGQEGPAYISCWPLFQHMTFISDTVKHRTTSSNFIEADTESSNSGIEQNTQATDDNGLSSCNSASTSGTDELQREEQSENGSKSFDDSYLSSEASPMPLSQKSAPKSSVKRKGRPHNEIDELLISSLATVRDKKPKVNDEEGYFGQVIAATLRRFNPRQKATAKLKIQEVLTNIEFPFDYTANSNQFTTPPMPQYQSVSFNSTTHDGEMYQ